MKADVLQGIRFFYLYRMENLQAIIRGVIPVINQAGDFIRKQAGNVSMEDIEHKSLNNLVSYVDKTAEEMLVNGLSTIMPEAGFLTEEETVEQLDTDWKWVIDPLDGTTNFLHQIPLFSVSVALMYKNEVRCGWVLDIMHHNMFYAWKDGGAYLNGMPISVSTQKDFGQALLVTGFPYGRPEVMERYVDVFHYLMLNTRGVRRLGSAAIDLAYVACGRFEAFYEYKLNPWDVAGGSIIVKEAGGTVMDFEGGEDYLFGKQIIATNGKITKGLTDVIKDRFFV